MINIFYSFDYDLLLQGLAAKNLADGHGLTIAQVHAGNLSQTVYDPLVGWPPGYSILVSPFYILFGKNIIYSCLFVNVAAAIVFLPLVWLLLKQLNFPVHIINFFILFYGLYLPDYEQLTFPTDHPAMLFCIWSSYLVIIFLKKDTQASWYGFFPGLICSLSAWFRYMYVPVCFVIPVLLIWNGYVKKDKRIVYGGLYSLLITVLSISALLIFQHLYTGSTTYLRPTSRGIFFQNLQYISPFVFSTFINLDFYTMQLSLLTRQPYPAIFNIFRLLGFIPALLFLFYFIKYCIKKRGVSNNSTDSFLLVAGLQSMAVIAILLYLSLTINAWYDFPKIMHWVYGMENRYFALPVFFLQVTIIWWLFVQNTQPKGKILYGLRIIILLLISLEMLHGLHLFNKSFHNVQSRTKPVTQSRQMQNEFLSMLEEGKSNNAMVVVASFDPTICGYAYLTGCKSLYKPYELANRSIGTEKRVLLKVFISDKYRSNFAGFLNRKDITRSTLPYLEGIGIYSCYIEPDKQTREKNN